MAVNKIGQQGGKNHIFWAQVMSFPLKLIENLSNDHKQRWPQEGEDKPYILGIGDQLTLVQMNEKGSNISDITNGDANASALNALTQNDDVIETRGRIGSDGSVLLLEVGRLEAKGKTINALRLEVRNILIRNGLSPKFQLEITGFNSQKHFSQLTLPQQVQRIIRAQLRALEVF